MANIKDLLDDEYTILLTTRFFNYLFDVYNGILIKDEYLNENQKNIIKSYNNIEEALKYLSNIVSWWFEATPE